MNISRVLTVVLILQTTVCLAQGAFGDDERIHTRTIFDGHAGIELPDDYSLTSSLSEDPDVQYSSSYFSRYNKASVSCNFYKEPFTLEQLKAVMQASLNMYDSEYYKMLRKVLAEDGGDSFFILEAMQKHEYLTGMESISDEDANYLPRYILSYYRLNKGKAVSVHISYNGALDGLEEFRKIAQYIISSYKWLGTTE